MLALAGVAVIAAGFLLGINPLLVVVASAFAAGIAAGLSPVAVLGAFGHAFNEARPVTVIFVMLPLIGLLERNGLQERARTLVAGLRGLTTGRLLLAYLALRQVTAALGLMSIAGHPQTVRPLLAPMATEASDGADEERVTAMAAATDNVGVFFGEDIFIAIGSILLMKGVLDGLGIAVEPWRLSLWAIPAALAAFAIHGARLLAMDRRR